MAWTPSVLKRRLDHLFEVADCFRRTLPLNQALAETARIRATAFGIREADADADCDQLSVAVPTMWLNDVAVGLGKYCCVAFSSHP